MADTSLVNMAQAFQGLPMKSLIGGPMNAACDANINLAMTQMQYILDAGFTGDGKETPYAPIMLAFNTESTSSKDGSKTTNTGNASLPLLSLIPIPTLGINNVDITFDMEVKSSFEEATDDKSQSSSHEGGEVTGKIGWGPFSVELKGSVSHDSSSSSDHSTKYSKSNDAKYHVEVQATQQELPKGFQYLVQACAASLNTSDQGK